MEKPAENTPNHDQNYLHSDPMPIVRVNGSYRQMGRQIGEEMRPQVQRSIENARSLIAETFPSLGLDWQGALIQAKKYLPFAQERYPQFVEEMVGIAEGGDVPVDDLAVLNVMEAVTMDALYLTKCTSMAVSDERTADGHVLAAHNEDWLPEDEANVFLIHATPEKDPPYLAMTYGGLLPNIGFNAYGIAQFCDTVYPTDSRIGIPRIIVSRAVLSAGNLEQAIRYMLVPQRAAGYNHLLAHESGELYSIEVSARHFAIHYAENGQIVHTNHFIDSKMQQIEDDPEDLIATRLRYFRASRLLFQTQAHTVRTLQVIQRDHLNFPNSICNHSTDHFDPLVREKTINAMVVDLTARAIHIAWGSPCENPYHTYYLEA